MDFTKAALKLLCGQLKEVKQISTMATSSSQFPSFAFGGILFQRAWLQGVIVSSSSSSSSSSDEAEGRLLLDDGTGVIELYTSASYQYRDWVPGMYVMVVGALGVCPNAVGETPKVKVHKIVDLSPYPNREAMWYLEVIEACKMFYQPPFDDLE